MQIFRYITGIFLLLGLIVLVEYLIGWRALVSPWRQVPSAPLMAAAALVFASYALRAVRLYDYFRPLTAGRFSACLRLMLWHNFFNNLLPMRSGELSFPLLMARYFAVPAARSVGALLWFRLLDLHTISVLALVALAWGRLPAVPLATLALAWLSLPWWGFRLQSVVLAWLEPRLPHRFHVKFRELRAGLPADTGAFWRSWLWTGANWVVKLGVFAWVLAVFLRAPQAALWLGAIGGELTSVLPVHGVAGGGTYEAGIVAGLLPFGIAPRDALLAAVNLHLFLLGLSIASGGMALLLKE